jgi:hypothetical protein
MRVSDILNRRREPRWCVKRQGAAETNIVAGPFKGREEAEKEKIRLKALLENADYDFFVTQYREDGEQPRRRNYFRKAGR